MGGAPSCIKISPLTISCSKVSIQCVSSYSGFKSRPSFSMTLYFPSTTSINTAGVIKEIWICLCSGEWNIAPGPSSVGSHIMKTIPERGLEKACLQSSVGESENGPPGGEGVGT